MLRPRCRPDSPFLPAWETLIYSDVKALAGPRKRSSAQRFCTSTSTSLSLSLSSVVPRTISGAPRLHAIRRAPSRSITTRPSPRETPESSLRNADADKTSQIPTDTGLLPGTIIPPASSTLSILRKSPISWLRLLYTLRRAKIRDLFSLLVYKTFTRPWLKLELSKTVPEATMLHSLMNNAYCARRIDTLQEICAGGLFEQLALRIESREPNIALEWRLHKSPAERATVVSNRAARMADGQGIRQAIVRIRSTQSLKRFTAGLGGHHTPVEGSGSPRQMDEHVVIERRLFKGTEGPWVIWGTVTPMTVDQILDRKIPKPEHESAWKQNGVDSTAGSGNGSHKQSLLHSHGPAAA